MTPTLALMIADKVIDLQHKIFIDEIRNLSDDDLIDFLSFVREYEYAKGEEDGYKTGYNHGLADC